jgi:hypothetical protein
MDVVTSVMLFLKGRTMKTKKNLSHNHELSAAGTVTAYDGWRETVTITLRDEHEDGTDEVTIELPDNVFAKLVEKVNAIHEEREAAKAKEEVEVE